MIFSDSAHLGHGSIGYEVISLIHMKKNDFFGVGSQFAEPK